MALKAGVEKPARGRSGPSCPPHVSRILVALVEPCSAANVDRQEGQRQRRNKKQGPESRSGFLFPCPVISRLLPFSVAFSSRVESPVGQGYPSETKQTARDKT